MLSSGQDFGKKFLDSKHVLKVYLKPSRKKFFFSFLPLPSLLVWLKIPYLNTLVTIVLIITEYSHRYHQQGQQNLQQPYGAPPPLPPHQHHQHGQYHPSHAHAHTHAPLHDENGVITNDPNDESATSDLATSYLAYRYVNQF